MFRVVLSLAILLSYAPITQSQEYCEQDADLLEINLVGAGSVTASGATFSISLTFDVVMTCGSGDANACYSCLEYVLIRRDCKVDDPPGPAGLKPHTKELRMGEYQTGTGNCGQVSVRRLQMKLSKLLPGKHYTFVINGKSPGIDAATGDYSCDGSTNHGLTPGEVDFFTPNADGTPFDSNCQHGSGAEIQEALELFYEELRTTGIAI